MALADERLSGPDGMPCFMNAGNDDPPEVDAVIDAAERVEFLEGRVVELPNGIELASCGYANRTPWNCPRDVEEPELAQRLDAVVAQVEDPAWAMFNFHCPPYRLADRPGAAARRGLPAAPDRRRDRDASGGQHGLSRR